MIRCHCAPLAGPSACIRSGRDGGNRQRVRLRHAARRPPGPLRDRPDRADRPIGTGQLACPAHQRAAVEPGQGPAARPGTAAPTHAAIRPVTRAPSRCAAVSRPLDKRGNANPVNPGRANLRGTARDRAKLHRNDVRRDPGRLRRLPLRHSPGGAHRAHGAAALHRRIRLTSAAAAACASSAQHTARPITRPARRQRRLAAVGGLADPPARLAVGLAALAVSGLGVHDRSVGRREVAMFRAVNELPDGLFVPAWVLMQSGSLGAGPVAAALSWASGRPRLAARPALGSIGSWALSKAIKGVYRRPRPSLLVDGVRSRGSEAGRTRVRVRARRYGCCAGRRRVPRVRPRRPAGNAGGRPRGRPVPHRRPSAPTVGHRRRRGHGPGRGCGRPVGNGPGRRRALAPTPAG